ncbi:MAG: class I SAM-dependent methyltransferase [Lachnospiraceae bacterium]|nr:class I SAM-dependent methyltransferase [Lachnospiraceae bacterium]
MRVIDEIMDINYKDTREFFKHRAGKFREENPYSVTMYQDDNKELVEARNKQEIEKLYPKLWVDESARILDIACGIGRWADAICNPIEEYCGIDFSKELIEIAQKRNKRENFVFLEGETYSLEKVLENKGKYNRVLMIGILMYLNDHDLVSTLEQVCKCAQENAILCVREPIGIQKRLTLKNCYSEELKDDYNAIYRTRDELVDFFKKTLFVNGFTIKEEGYLFENVNLNNRKETVQYYFILER